MKKVLGACFGVLLLGSIVVAEPILTEESKCLGKGNLEIGLGASYGVDTWTIKEQTNSADYKVSLISVGLPIKYGVSDKLQFNLNVPYRSWKYKVDPDSSYLSEYKAGMGQIGVGGKLAFSESLAMAVDVQTPTGDVDKMLGEGTDAGLMLIISGNLNSLKVSVNTGYILKMKYKDKNKIEWDPGDPLIVKGAIEYPINKCSLIGEAQFQSFGKTKYTPNGGTATDWIDSNGSTLDFLVGTQYIKDAMKLKLGFELAAGSEDYRAGNTRFNFYDSWDWKVILSGAYKFEI
ncbi:MAG: hypothetical protein PHE88_04585 [Elusimicrobia bacterium]|nr:hypothetical protein [Elusimicrobiota bacterium]